MLRRLAVLLLALATLTAYAGCAAGDDGDDPAPLPAHGVGEPTDAATTYAEYVALGDSYTAAPLVPPTDTSTTCLRSERNYPAIVTEGLPGTRLTDVSCGGATTTDMTRPQQGQQGSVPPQFEALEESTDLVTIGLGGNDGGLFGTMILRCTILASQQPQGTPCTGELGPTVDNTLARIQQNLQQVVAGVRERSPKARVLLVGYPQIVPASGSCPALPLAPGDYPFVRTVNERLTQAVAQAAQASDAEYVDVWTASAGHDICGADPWINGKDTQLDKALAFHPFASEQQAVAELVLEAVRRPAP